MLRSLLSFRTRHQPYMVRLSYRYEMRSALTFPLASSLGEGSFTAVIAAKYFAASTLLIAVITAAPMFGNIMAMVWSELSARRRKVPFVNWLQAGVVVLIASVACIAWLPRYCGGWVFASQIILVRLLASGIITVRSVIWRVNYPRHIRGQIIGRITFVATAVLAAITLAGSAWLDRNPHAFVYLYPGAALLGAIGIWQFSHIRVRGEAVSLRRLRQQLYTPGPEGISQTDETNVMNYAPGDEGGGFRRFFLDAFTILRQDKPFRDYQRWQFLSGVSFMMFGPSLLAMVSRDMTDPTRQYLLATVVVQIVPIMVTLLSTPLWAPLFDRVHITVFRVYQCSVSVLAQVTLFAGAMYGLYWCNRPGWTGALAIITVGQALVGLALGGGNLAWNLAPNAYASRDKAATYMAVHVMLTGLRGCIAPFLGAWFYQTPWVGRWVFALSAAVCVVAWLGFLSMARHAPRKGSLPQATAMMKAAY